MNVCLDNNSLQPPNGSKRDVERFMAMWEEGEFQVVVPHGVVGEASNVRTPTSVRAALTGGIYTLPTAPTASEVRLRQLIEAELQGNAKRGKHIADASHLAEAAKYGGYFITHDARVLERAGRLGQLLPPSLQVVTLERFLEIFDGTRGG